VAALLIGERDRGGQCGPHRSLVVTALLGERYYCGRGSAFGSFAAAAFVGRLCQRVFLRGPRLSALFPNCRLGLSVPLVSLVSYGLCARG
jgi:hypothetical protein